MLKKLVQLTIVIVGWYLVIPVLAHSSDCTVTFGLADRSVSVSGVIVEVDYSAFLGDLPGDADQVAWSSGVPGALATFNDIASERRLKAGVVRLAPFGGESLFSCTVTGAVPSAQDFSVTTVDATDASLNSVVPAPAVVVTGINCAGRSVTTTTSTTTTTMAPPAGGCLLRLRANSATPISGLVFELDYASSGAEIVGSGGKAACTTLVPNALGAYNDIEADGVLSGAIVRVAGFSGPTPVAECELDAMIVPVAADFSVRVVEAVDPSGTDIVPPPVVEISEIVCDTGAGPRSGGPGTPPADPGSGACGTDYDVTLAVEANGPLASLQFDVGYADAPGGFTGSSESVECENLVDGALSSFNDDESSATLRAGFISLGGFATPAALARCRFRAEGRAPVAEDFAITVVDAASADLGTADALVRVASIEPVAVDPGCGGCGDGILEPGEECDDGSQNSDTVADACRTDCTLPACGDGVVDSGEECDDGNSSDTDACTSECRQARCGDGFLFAGVEECDEGERNSDVQPDACRTNCRMPACGDGVADSGEECDDGNDDPTDACLPGCVAARCGDGIVWQGVEECDDGPANDDAEPEACRTDCRLPEVCGDADGDGRVTATDARRILYGAVGLVADCDNGHCDADGDGRVTATDARKVLRAAIGVSEEALDCSLPIIFRLEDAVVVGALQIAVDYSATGATFVGSGDRVWCASLAGDGVLASFNNAVDSSQLIVGLVSPAGIAGPADLFTCAFRQGAQAPRPEDFVVDVVDVSGPDGQPIDPPAIGVRP